MQMIAQRHPIGQPASAKLISPIEIGWLTSPDGHVHIIVMVMIIVIIIVTSIISGKTAITAAATIIAATASTSSCLLTSAVGQCNQGGVS